MSRYIDKDKLIESLKRNWCNAYWYGLDECGFVIRGITKEIEEFSEADVVKVVRCRDCMWWTKEKDSLQGRCELFPNYSTGMWYCANGETEEKSVTNE